ncbi:MAG: DNA-directed RNA polymerase subunit K [Nanoarchaeota archaeon]|nr:DNA-directed RNA polymerase subunit K [Nanoarchaeota archaeon]MBU1051789.1 DNA-directed RNA polymerase subunit K [Nanoarchaeota archaeon]MBU1988783.1 DNA-directed RNA polymerase subunit K [Nanoarchaeota archaeon]
MEQQFTKYEITRIVGARALQIAMDAPLLLKITTEKLKEIKYDALEIADLEFKEGVLPISIKRPTPKKSKEKLGAIKEEKLSDEEIIEKAQEVEKEIVQDAKEMGFVNEADADESGEMEDSGEEK